MFREGEIMEGDVVTRKAIDEVARGSTSLSARKIGDYWALFAVVQTPSGSHRLTREPVIHSQISGGLPTSHPKAFKGAACRGCGVLLHATNNETMRTWYETEHGDFCTVCFVPGEVLEHLEDATGLGIEP